MRINFLAFAVLMLMVTMLVPTASVQANIPHQTHHNIAPLYKAEHQQKHQSDAGFLDYNGGVAWCYDVTTMEYLGDVPYPDNQSLWTAELYCWATYP